MPIRRITVPEPAEITTLDGDPIRTPDGTVLEPIAFRMTVARLLNHAGFATSRKSLRAALSIEQAVWSAEPGSHIDLAEEDWELLRKAAEAPGDTGFGTTVLRRLVHHLDAIVDAPEAKPSGAAVAAKAEPEARAE